VNNCDLVVFDLETGGLDPAHHEAIQVAGKAYNARTLEPYPVEQGGEFCSLMRPLHPERLTDAALKVNGKSRDELLGNPEKGIEPAPDQGVVWNQFVAWVGKWNKKGSAYGAPIACGKNIRDFDLKFVAVLNQLHCKKKDKTVLFSRRTQLDLEDLIFLWFENSKELPDGKMDTLRDYFGMSREGAHDALVDVRQTGALLMRFLKLHRELARRTTSDGRPFIKFQGSMHGIC
jgi:DNA polymerase III epsilon subunit-like protein